MKVKAEVPQPKIIDIICDICGKSCSEQISTQGNDFNFQTAFVTYNWGYGVPSDGNRGELHVCYDCFVAKIKPLFEKKK